MVHVFNPTLTDVIREAERLDYDLNSVLMGQKPKSLKAGPTHELPSLDIEQGEVVLLTPRGEREWQLQQPPSSPSVTLEVEHKAAPPHALPEALAAEPQGAAEEQGVPYTGMWMVLLLLRFCECFPYWLLQALTFRIRRERTRDFC